MEELLGSLSENKVNQNINVNKFEQSISYVYAKKEFKECYEDLFKKKPKSSINSLSSLSSCGNLSTDDSIYYSEDAFIYLMAYIRYPTISLHSKDNLTRLLSDFRKDLVNDEHSFQIKKMNKTQKQTLQNKLLSGEPFQTVDDTTLSYFSHILKVNIVLITNGNISKGILCKDEGFDTILITDIKNTGKYKMLQIHGKPVCSWTEAKFYIFEKRWLESTFIDMYSVSELHTIAQKLDIHLYTEKDGKKTRLLKEQIKVEIAKKI